MQTFETDRSSDIQRSPRRVRALVNGHVIADTDDALVLRRGDAAPAYFFPRSDVERGFLSETAHVTETPGVGRATWFTIRIHSDVLENVAYSYEQPEDAAFALGGRIAFDTGEIEVYEVGDDDLKHRHHPDHPTAPQG